MSLPDRSLTASSLNATNEILPQSMRALLSKAGKTAEGKTVSIKDSDTFNPETIQDLREKFHAVLTDIQNLHKARKVVWNEYDMHGKKGSAWMKQIFVNLKHNARSTLIGKKGEAKASKQLAEDVKKLEEALAENKYVIPHELAKEFCEFYDELKAQRPNGYADTKAQVMNLIGNKANLNGTFVPEVQRFLNGHISVTSDCGTKDNPSDIDTLTERFKKNCNDKNEVNTFRDLLQSYENRITASDLKNKITEYLSFNAKNTLPNFDKETNALMEKLTKLSENIYEPFGITTVELEGGYEVNFFKTKNTDDNTVENKDKIVIANLKENFERAFPKEDKKEFEEWLPHIFTVQMKALAIDRLKKLVFEASTGGFSKELKHFFQDAFKGEISSKFKESFMGKFPMLAGMAAEIESLIQEYQQKTGLSTFDRLEKLLETTVPKNQVSTEEGGFLPKFNNSAQTEKLYV